MEAVEAGSDKKYRAIGPVGDCKRDILVFFELKYREEPTKNNCNV
jgi:hypothetical protein